MFVLDLRRFVPHGRVSTGLVACYQGFLVWALSQEKYWLRQDMATIVPIIGIGGGQEQGETLTEAVARECMEEARVKVELLSSPKTLWVSSKGNCTMHSLGQVHPDEPMPALIWERKIVLRNALGHSSEVDYINSVYCGRLYDAPNAGAEIPGLLFMPVELYLSLRERRCDLGQLLSNGAVYTGLAIDDGVLIELQGSSLYVAQHWDHIAQTFPGGIS